MESSRLFLLCFSKYPIIDLMPSSLPYGNFANLSLRSFDASMLTMVEPRIKHSGVAASSTVTEDTVTNLNVLMPTDPSPASTITMLFPFLVPLFGTGK